MAPVLWAGHGQGVHIDRASPAGLAGGRNRSANTITARNSRRKGPASIYVRKRVISRITQSMYCPVSYCVTCRCRPPGKSIPRGPRLHPVLCVCAFAIAFYVHRRKKAQAIEKGYLIAPHTGALIAVRRKRRTRGARGRRPAAHATGSIPLLLRRLSHFKCFSFHVQSSLSKLNINVWLLFWYSSALTCVIGWRPRKTCCLIHRSTTPRQFVFRGKKEDKSQFFLSDLQSHWFQSQQLPQFCHTIDISDDDWA